MVALRVGSKLQDRKQTEPDKPRIETPRFPHTSLSDKPFTSLQFLHTHPNPTHHQNGTPQSRRQAARRRKIRVNIPPHPPLQASKHSSNPPNHRWAPITDADPTACGRPQEYDASSAWANKKVVLFSVPGAFTPGCQAHHLPPYISQRSKFAEKGVDIVAVIASNDSWVMNAWGKVNGVKGEDILFLSDTKTFFSKEFGWAAGMGERK